MSDAIHAVTAVNAAGQDGAATAAPMFSRLMGPGPAIDDGSTRTFTQSLSSFATQLQQPGPSIEELQHSMLQSINPRDPLMTMVTLADHTIQAHQVFARLHIANGLASAAVSLFGGLLKNQG